MRNHGLLITLVAALLVAAAAGTALAQPGGAGSREAGQEHRSAAQGNATGNETDDRVNGTARAEAAQARAAELRAARNASLASFHENRTAAIEAFHAAHNATRTSFLENKTKVVEGCRAARNESRAEGNASAASKCVRDGLKPLIEKARAEHKAALDAFHAALREARQHAMESFRSAKAHADARAARDG